MNRQLTFTPIPSSSVMSWKTPILENDLMYTMIIETVRCSEGSGYIQQTALRQVSQNSKESVLNSSVTAISNLRVQQATFSVNFR